MRYLLQLNGGRQWEEVDEVVFAQWQHATEDKDDTPRYSGCRLTIGDSGEVTIQGTFAPEDFVLIARLTGCPGQNITPQLSLPGGIVLTPAYVPIVKKAKRVVRQVGIGTYRAAAA